VRVRLVDPIPSTAAAFVNHLGPALAPVDNFPPDIIVYFQEKLIPNELKYLGLNSVGFTDEEFYLLDKITGKIQARIQFESIGERCEIVAQRNSRSVPLLFDIINFTCLKKKYVSLHASAFVYNEVGIMVMGWPKGGKTGAMLSFINDGARYVGDEWVLISSDGQKMFGIPVSVGISEWQFKHIPELIPEISIQQQLFFKSIHLLDSTQGAFERSRFKNSFPSKILRKALPAFKRQLKISKSPQVIFKDQIGKLEATPEKFFLIISHSRPEIRVERCDPMELAWRMISANEYEQREFFDYYKAFKFAFPLSKNEFLESAYDYQRSLLFRAFEDKETYKVFHPYAGSLETLFTQMQPFCQKTNKYQTPSNEISEIAPIERKTIENYFH
jgi:hypothetical protein